VASGMRSACRAARPDLQVALFGRRALPRQRFTDDAVEIGVARPPVELL
jgi:hypothetical protein